MPFTRSRGAGDTFGQHFDDFVEVLSREMAVGIGAAKEVEELRFVPILCGAHCDNLLREDVHGGFGDCDAIEIALANGAHKRGGFQQVIACGCKEPALGNCAAPVSGATNALQANGNGTRRADLADEVDAADIDAELQRRGGDQRAYFSGFEFLFRGEAQLARQTSVVGSYRIASETFRQMMGDTLRQAPRVDEDQRRRMLPGELGDAVVNFAPHLIRGNRAKLAARNFDGDVHLALVADVYDRGRGALGTGEEVSDHFDWLLRGRKADARQRSAGQMIEALERQREMSAALVVGVFKISRLLAAVNRMYSDSGVVTRMCGGRASMARRSWASVSPVRTAMRISGMRIPRRPANCRISPSGISRFFWMSLLRALSGET